MSTGDNNLDPFAAFIRESEATTHENLVADSEALTLIGEARYSQSLDRGLAILLCFTAERPVLGIADLAEMLGMSRSTTHRYVTTLVTLGYLRQGARRKYSLALRVTELGLETMNATALDEHARPYIEELTRRSGYAVGVAILDGSEALLLDLVAPRGARRGHSHVDPQTLLPAHCSAAGKLLIANLPAYERRAVVARLRLDRHGPQTITSKRALRAELDAIPEEGLAVSVEELAIGLLEIAAPVRSESSEIVAAVTMSAHSSTISPHSFVDELGPHLISTADRVAARLGYRRDDERQRSERDPRAPIDPQSVGGSGAHPHGLRPS